MRIALSGDFLTCVPPPNLKKKTKKSSVQTESRFFFASATALFAFFSPSLKKQKELSSLSLSLSGRALALSRRSFPCLPLFARALYARRHTNREKETGAQNFGESKDESEEKE